MVKRNKLDRQSQSLLARFRVTSGRNFRLSDIDPGDIHTFSLEQKPDAQMKLAQDIQLLQDLQDRLTADDKYALLLIFQAMDAAGKDSTIKHVMSGVNPQGCQVFAFKEPSAEELDHDFMWRYMRCLPERGRIGIFNRSYYEEVLVVRVNEELLVRQKLPEHLITRSIWKERLEDIASTERYLARNGVIVLKFYLHLSKKEQEKRLLERLDKPEKNWKFAQSDLHERELWRQYMHAYEEAIRATATKHAPWYIVPADHKWFTRIVVAAAIVEALQELNLKYPAVSKTQQRALAEARRALLGTQSR